MSDAMLALDLGTSSVKAALVAGNGEVLGIARATYPTHQPHPGWSEQNPADWWQAVAAATRELTAAHREADVAAIGLTGQMHGTVLLDREGIFLDPAIIWSDRRSAAQQATIAEEIGPDLPRLIGGPLGVGYQATTLRWLAEQRPELVAQIGGVLLPKDALGYHLTGVRATEPSDAISTGLLDAETWTWSPPMIAASHVDAAWLPLVVPSGSIIGQLRADRAAELGLPADIPVVLAGGDAPSAAFGADVTTPDTAMLVLSSGAQVIVPTPGFAPDATGRWHTFPSAVGRHGIGELRNRVGATSNAGLALQWLGERLAKSVKALLDDARDTRPGAEGVVFVPHLTGMRTPVVDPQARGAFFGLTNAHDDGALARAAIEGILFACRDVFTTLMQGGQVPSRIRVGGGIAHHAMIGSLVANIFAMEVEMLDSPDLTVIGAARSAALAIGWGDPLVSLTPTAISEPDPDLAAWYGECLGVYQAASNASRDIAHRFARLDDLPRGHAW